MTDIRIFSDSDKAIAYDDDRMIAFSPVATPIDGVLWEHEVPWFKRTALQRIAAYVIWLQLDHGITLRKTRPQDGQTLLDLWMRFCDEEKRQATLLHNKLRTWLIGNGLDDDGYVADVWISNESNQYTQEIAYAQVVIGDADVLLFNINDAVDLDELGKEMRVWIDGRELLMSYDISGALRNYRQWDNLYNDYRNLVIQECPELDDDGDLINEVY